MKIALSELQLVAETATRVIDEFHESHDDRLQDLTFLGGFSKVAIFECTVIFEGKTVRAGIVCGDIPWLIFEADSGDATFILQRYINDGRKWVADMKSKSESEVPIELEQLYDGDNDVDKLNRFGGRLDYIQENMSSIVDAWNND